MNTATPGAGPERLPAVIEATPAMVADGNLGASPAIARARAYLLAARASSTRRAYASDWVHFTDWCERQPPHTTSAYSALPAAPETVALYLAEHASALKPASLTRRCSSISAVHQAAGLTSPTTSPVVRGTMAGIRRVHGTAAAAKEPLLAHNVRRLIDALPQQPTKALLAARDRCLIVLGFYGALRRSELVALDVADVEVNDQGLILAIRRSKTDQDGAGRRIAMLHTGSPDSCPAEIYQSWLVALSQHLSQQLPAPEDLLRIWSDGAATYPVFRPINRHDQAQPTRLTGHAVASIVQRTARSAGLGHLDFAGHSLRAGFATSAAAAGKSERAIMKQTGHKSLPMVRRYIREGSLFRDNATDGLTL